MTTSTSSRGIYGFVLAGIEPPEHLLVPVDPSMPVLRVHRVPVGSVLADYGVTASAPLVGGGEAGMNLETGDAYYAMPRTLSDAEMLHPWLAGTAAWLAYKVGRLVVHGGLISHAGLALALIGERNAGKSSLTAWIASSQRPMEIMSDDVIVVDHDTVFAGPRCVDLRPPALAFFKDRVAVQPARDNTRFRVELPPCAPQARLTGIVVLEWNDAFALRPVPPTQRLTRLLDHLAVTDSGRPVMQRLLELASLPMWVLERPRDARLFDRAADLLAGLISDRVVAR